MHYEFLVYRAKENTVTVPPFFNIHETIYNDYLNGAFKGDITCEGLVKILGLIIF